MDRFAVVDVETTGLEDNAEIVEIGLTILADGHLEAVSSILVQPERGIPPEASAVHHITEESLKDERNVYTRKAAGEWLEVYSHGVVAVAAHNAKFDIRFLPELQSLPLICTMNVAKHLWPDAPSYGLQVLRYWRGLQDKYVKGHPHRAAYDTAVTAYLLAEQLDQAGGVDELVRLTNEIPLLKVCSFGKHQGTPWEAVPRDYMRWLVGAHEKALRLQGRPDAPRPFPEDVVHTCRHYLKG